MRTVISERIIGGVRCWRVIWTCECGRVSHSHRNENYVKIMIQLILKCEGCGEAIALHKEDFKAELVK